MVMNKEQTRRARSTILRKYHTPGCANHIRRPVNAIYTSTANSLLHEAWKLKICRELMQNGKQFITEAVRNELDHKGAMRRVDIVELDTGLEIEIETDPKRAARFNDESNVLVIKVWELEGKLL